MEVWATASLFCCQLCDPPLSMEGKEKFSCHLVDEHDTPYRQYAKKCQDYKLVSSCHTCKVGAGCNITGFSIIKVQCYSIKIWTKLGDKYLLLRVLQSLQL